MNSEGRRVLCVEDDADTSEFVKFLLEKECRCEVVCASTLEECLLLCDSYRFDLFILDYWMPESSGVALCALLRLKYPETPIIFFTGEAREEFKAEAFRSGADAYLVKPDDLGKLAETVERLI